MLKVSPVSDLETKFEVSFETCSAVLEATDIMILWDECAKGSDLEIRYAELQRKLAERYNSPVSRGTAYLILEAAVGIISTLKKTHIG